MCKLPLIVPVLLLFAGRANTANSLRLLPKEAAGPAVPALVKAIADPETGDLGGAVQLKFFGVGLVVPFAKAGVGAVATQAFANTTGGPRGSLCSSPASLLRRPSTS